MASLTGLNAQRKGVGAFLKEGHLKVPIYQRAYAWAKEHVEDLFEDLEKAIGKDAENEYFLGSVVATKKKSIESDLVDGQQRICTVTILLAAIRDKYLLLGDEEGAEIVEDSYLSSPDLKTREQKQRLFLGEEDNDFYLNTIIEKPEKRSHRKPTMGSHRRLNSAYRSAVQLIEKQTEKVKSKPDRVKEILFEWVEFIRDRVQVVLLSVPNEIDAFVVFETLNDRGLELSTSDLLKNYLFGQTGKQRLNEVKHNWSKMGGILAASTKKEIITTFIHQFWSSKYGRTRKRELFKEICGEINDSQSAISFSNELVGGALLYSALTNSDHDFWSEYGGVARSHLKVLNEHLRAGQIRTLLLATLAEFNKTEFKKILPLCVSWTVRYLIGGGSPGNLESYYNTSATKVRKRQIKNAKALAHEMSNIIPDDDQFRSSFAAARASTERVARYYLRCINAAIDHARNPHLSIEDDTEIASLEHILPQNPSAANWGHIQVEERSRLITRIGNMTLLDSKSNSSRNNDAFDLAKKAYGRSGMPITKELAVIQGPWDKTKIDERQAGMAVIAAKVWKITLSG